MTAILTAAYWQQRFTQAAPDDEQRAFHKGLKWDFVVLALWTLNLFLWAHNPEAKISPVYSLTVFVFVLYPLWKLFTGVQLDNFFQLLNSSHQIFSYPAFFLKNL